MGKRYQLVIFDVDGTLLDTTEGLLSSVLYTADYFRFERPCGDMLRRFIGPPIQDSFASCYGLSGEILQEIATVFRNHYKNFGLLKAKPYEGIYDVMEGIAQRGKEIAVATYKREDYALELMHHFHFDDYAGVIHGADHENKLTKGDIIGMCIAESNGGRETSLMVGDTESDAHGAQVQHVDFLAVSYGFGWRHGDVVDGCNCVGMADAPMEILKIIDNVEGNNE